MYSRRLKLEERKNKRKAYFFILLSFLMIVLIFTYGLSAAAKFSAFLLELRKNSEPVEVSDTTPPPPPRFEPLPEYTNKDSLDLVGSSEAGSIITINFKGKKYEVVANNDGKFLLSLTLTQGENILLATAKDKSANESQETRVKIILDKEPPSLEITKPEDGSEFFGSRHRQIIIEGKTEENAKVQINDRLVVVETDGTFSFLTTLSQGENNFIIKSEDPAGNKTEKNIKLFYSQ